MAAVVPVSKRPPARYQSGADFALWLRRFQLYTTEAGIDAAKQAQELLSLLEDEPFRVADQLGLVGESDVQKVKDALLEHFAPEGNEMEWQMILHQRVQKKGEKLAEFAGDLRKLADKAYPKWDPKIRLQLATSRFIQGVASQSTQLTLMRKSPPTLDEALKEATQFEMIEATQRAIQRPSASQVMAAEPVSRYQQQIDTLSQHVKTLTAEVEKLTKTGQSSRSIAGRRGSRGRCWNCGRYGHFQRDCRTEKQSNVQSVSCHKMGTMVVKGAVNNIPTDMLVDTGSAITLLRQDVWSQAASPKLEDPERRVITANGEDLHILGQANVCISVGSVTVNYPVLVTSNLTQPCLLGADFLNEQQCLVDLYGRVLKIGKDEVPLLSTADSLTSVICHLAARETLTIPGEHQIQLPVYSLDKSLDQKIIGMIEPLNQFVENTHLFIARSLSACVKGCTSVCVLNLSSAPVTVHRDEKVATFSVGAVCSVDEVCTLQSNEKVGCGTNGIPQFGSEPDLPDDKLQRFNNLVQDFTDIFAHADEDLGRTPLTKHTIRLKGSITPIKQHYRRVPFFQRPVMQQLIRKMLADNIIEPSSGPWASPVVLVTKKDGSARFCVDFRKLNAVTQKDAQQLPRIDETLEYLSGSCCFSSLDLASGYWQVPMDEADKPKTAFTTPFGLYQFNVMPFGLCNAPATFQRLMTRVLAGLHWSVALVYLDDIIVFSPTIEEHFDRLEKVFQALRQAKLKVKPRKCHFFQSNIKYLGHIVSKKGISTDPEKTSVIVNWPTPAKVKDVRQFLGITSYYRKFIKSYAQISKPLIRLTETKSKWLWSRDCEAAFNSLKQSLINPPILSYPQFHLSFVLDVDASNDGLGGVLSQEDPAIPGERVVAYASRVLTKQERKYCTTRKELLALVWGIQHFKPYLYGRSFVARTDHGSLSWLKSFKELEGQLARWLQVLEQFDFQVVHRPGEKHANADALSRGPCHQCGCDHVCTLSDKGISWLAEWPSKFLAQEQRKDPDLKQVIDWCSDNTMPEQFPKGASHITQSLWAQRHSLLIQEDILYRKWHDVENSGAQQHLQAILPAHLKECVLGDNFMTILSQGPISGNTKQLQKFKEDFIGLANVRIYNNGVKSVWSVLPGRTPLADVERRWELFQLPILSK